MYSGNRPINSIKHSAIVKVDESGTDAAAATAIVYVFGVAPRPLRVNIDRPFFFAIRDNRTGSILFMGAVVDPND
jgi:serine protease inhibitor